MFLRPDGGGCTGIMVNNTANDGTPYFYLANHCYAPNENQWVFYFNYDSPTCVGDTGQTQETIVGASFRAAEHYSDFALVELFNAPHLVYDVDYAGWDRSNAVPTTAATIMHPAFDVKKITIDYGPVIPSGTGTPLGSNTPTWITSWDTGIVETGASGAPILDQNKRLIGNLTEAWGDCTNLGGVVSSKFSYQWDFGPTINHRLAELLDPLNTGDLIIDPFIGGLVPSSITLPLNVFLTGPLDTSSMLMSDQLRVANYVPLTEPYSNLGFNHV